MRERPKSFPVDASYQHNLPLTSTYLLKDDLDLSENLWNEIFTIEKDSPAAPPFPLATSSGPIRRW